MLRHKGWRAARSTCPRCRETGRDHHRPGGNRNRVRHRWNRNTSSASTWAPPTPPWPMRETGADADPVRSGQRAAAAHSATGEPRRSARRSPAAVVPLPARRDRFSRRARSRCRGTPSRGYVVGRLAQKRGVENAGRLVSSAKSLAVARRRGPHRAPAALPRAGRRATKISPVEASRRYLEHLRAGLGSARCRTRPSPSSRCW